MKILGLPLWWWKLGESEKHLCMVRDSHWTVVDRGCARHQPKSRWWKDVAGGSCWQPRGRLTTEWVTGMRPVWVCLAQTGVCG
jgi:hypothetical protein